MPKEDDIGYGECTDLKIIHLSDILAMHLAITKAVLKKHDNLYHQKYRYFDLTAGKGFYPDGTKGSPLVFLENIESAKFGYPYRADFIERNNKNIKTLETVITSEAKKNGWVCKDIHFHHGSCQQKIPSIIITKNSKEFGLFFVDPSGEPPDFNLLKLVSELRPKMEILIYLSSTNVKRIYQFTGKRLKDHVDLVCKKYWLIRKPVDWDQFKWTFLLGSNSSLFKDYKKINFLRLDTARGQEIFDRLNLTEQEFDQRYQLKLM